MQPLRILLAIVLFLLAGPSNLTLARGESPSRPHARSDGKDWAQTTLDSLSVEEKVGQLFMIRLRVELLESDSEYSRLRDAIHKYHIGALAMSAPRTARAVHRDQRYRTVMLLNRLQGESKLPLLVAGDFEQGVLPPRLFGTTVFPHAMAFGAAGKTEYAEEFGRITAQESRAIGVHWNLFPVADVNSNPANPIIGTRAFGADPQRVGELVAAYIKGARANGMLTTAKHFPGHGNTATDSHLGVARVDEDLQGLYAVDLPPFRRAIGAGVDAIMTAHVRVPTLDPDPNRVATTSPKIVTDLLRNQLGFKGLVVADALDMAGLTRLYGNNPGRTAVDAFKAGDDVLTMPADLDASYRAVLESVRSGEISQARLNASVLKILRAKASVGLDENRLVDVAAIARRVGTPQNTAVGQRISDDSVTLVRDNREVLPLAPWGLSKVSLQSSERQVRPSVLLIVLCDSIKAQDGRVLEREIRARRPDANVIYVDPRLASLRSDQVLGAVAQARSVVVGVYIVPSAARSMQLGRISKHPASLPDSTSALLDGILRRASEKTVVLAMGSPYLTDDFPAIQNYICTFSNATVSEISAAKALFGEIPIHGHMPVYLSKAGQGPMDAQSAKIVKVRSTR
ncbi:MAG TPA: glycoside hydrolase family 3 protein [Candidatus Sulfotelmatobacter sp.]|nr:glycoside hydrolase family 3 protein [Candidatus Sulfotelmatobacter sp.]